MKTLTKSIFMSVVLAGCFSAMPAKSQTHEEENLQEVSGEAMSDSVEAFDNNEAPAAEAGPLDTQSMDSVPNYGAGVIHLKVDPSPRKFDQMESIAYYQNRYILKTPYEKKVDNRGNGYENLYGVRNFRAVLNGVVYRGGANNAYNKYKKRNNSNPLPPEGITNLCKEGFGTAVYLYSTNFSTAPKVTNCISRVDKSAQKFNYMQASPHASTSDALKVLTMIHKKLTTDTDHSPIYLHCWNGWHASGLISAYTLRQFCGFTGEQAVRYWDRNTDGVNKGETYDRLRAKIRAFKPYTNLKISSAVKAQVCPSTASF